MLLLWLDELLPSEKIEEIRFADLSMPLCSWIKITVRLARVETAVHMIFRRSDMEFSA